MKTMKDEAFKQGSVREQLFVYCNRFLRDGEIRVCIEHLFGNFKRYFWRYN